MGVPRPHRGKVSIVRFLSRAGAVAKIFAPRLHKGNSTCTRALVVKRVEVIGWRPIRLLWNLDVGRGFVVGTMNSGATAMADTI